MLVNPYVFGRHDSLAIIKPTTVCAVSSEIAYTHPTINGCYSKYGFSYPLDFTLIPLHILLDDKLIITDSLIESMTLNREFLLIDHAGLMWKIVVGHDDGVLRYNRFYIDTTTEGWWIASIGEGGINEDLQMLLGFLATLPPQEKIDDFTKTYWASHEMLWLSVTDIVANLHLKFPQDKKDKSPEKESTL